MAFFKIKTIEYLKSIGIKISHTIITGRSHNNRSGQGVNELGDKYINDTFGSEYIGYVKSTKKKDNVQDAHEAIRPTSPFRTPEEMKKYLSNDEYKLYKMIHSRAIASIMKDAKVLATTVVLDNNNYQFKTSGQVIVFDGYFKQISAVRKGGFRDEAYRLFRNSEGRERASEKTEGRGEV